MFRKEKIFVFLVVLISVVALFSTLSFADADVSVDDNVVQFIDKDGFVYTLPSYPENLSEYNHYVVLFDYLGRDFYLLPFNSTFEIVDNSDSSFNILLDGHDFCDGTIWSTLYVNGTFTPWALPGCSFRFSKVNDIIGVADSCSCMSSYRNDLYRSINGVDCFFTNRQGVLVPIMEEAPLAEAMREVVTILPIVLVTIVGLIGLRKALQMLSTVLHRS